MNDNLRRYRAIKRALVQLYPSEPTSRLLQSLHVMAMFINGIVASKSTHTRDVAKKTPTGGQGHESGETTEPLVLERASEL